MSQFHRLDSKALCINRKVMVTIVYLSFFSFSVLQEGSTCVHIAAMKGSVSVVKELLKFNPSGITTARNKVTEYEICQVKRNAI